MRKAFTMIEIILVIVILGIVVGVGTQIIKFSHDNEQRIRTLNELEIKSQVTMDFLTKHLGNAIKNSYRLKLDENAKCMDSATNCAFLYNREEDFNNFTTFEWARVAILDKRKGLWKGISETRTVLQKIKDTNDAGGSCYSTVGADVFFECFYPKITTTNSYGIYFLGDNIANTNTFFERDLQDFTDNKIKLKPNKNFVLSNAFVLVDNVEGIIYDKKKKNIRFYSYPWADRDDVSFSLNGTKGGHKAHILVNDVSEFKMSDRGGVTRLKLCLERYDMPGSFINTAKTIKVCKTGVVI